MATIDIRDKAVLDGIVAAVEAEMAPLEARKAEISAEKAALAAEERAIDKKLESWRGGMAAAQKARDLWFPPGE